ncbi:hypothetical protein [Aureibacter tunicatorum]|uniref:Lipocalin-like domain-containing protein n=1 Tax=Aureibacter tunicatorum TaxID=866807 RepID=A0AAE4BU65_9BACT|nr:hypothetical protein [Aureibacter tunicatorum]MDR6240448.1 hypothetical protein [Aureibacter tunicatorum]BDD05673.1 hypothetical protein AUTU_31560 [Aureibacter tunicatorum]
MKRLRILTLFFLSLSMACLMGACNNDDDSPAPANVNNAGNNNSNNNGNNNGNSSDDNGDGTVNQLNGKFENVSYSNGFDICPGSYTDTRVYQFNDNNTFTYNYQSQGPCSSTSSQEGSFEQSKYTQAQQDEVDADITSMDVKLTGVITLKVSNRDDQVYPIQEDDDGFWLFYKTSSDSDANYNGRYYTKE